MVGRLDHALAAQAIGWSRRELKAAFHEGRVCAEGKRLTAATPACPGMIVHLVELEPATLEPLPELRVVYEDQALVVVEKAPGIPAYPLHPHERGNVAAAVRARFPDLEGVGDLREAPGLCHRLDLETSGLLLFARTAVAFAALRQAFEARAVGKLYQAVVQGRLEGAGEIAYPLARPLGRGARMVALTEAHQAVRKSWPALSRYQVVAHHGERTCVEVTLVTGVTHQARVHLAALGHPIVGDVLYGGPLASRLYLHAMRLTIPHPLTGALLTVQSPNSLSC